MRAAGGADSSRPVDLDLVTARLLDISADGSPPPRARQRLVKNHGLAAEGKQPLSPERSETAEEPNTQYAQRSRMWETEHYARLVELGGRPLYHISLLEKVSANPDEYHRMLRPWLENPNSKDPLNWTTVFERQIGRWRPFLAWQKERRGVYNPAAEYSAFLERYRRECLLNGGTSRLDKLEADPLSVWGHFDYMENCRRREQFRRPKLGGDGGFPAHVERMKQCLAEHGFTRRFRLDEDLSRQDKLATWIEYLYYEYC